MGRIRWASSGAGEAASGFISTLTDLVSEMLDQSYFCALPGHPQQAADSLDICGEERALIKYQPSAEFWFGTLQQNQALWISRVARAWEDYEQAGTPQAVLRGVEDWGNETYNPEPLFPWGVKLAETGWANFRVDLGVDVPFYGPHTCGDGVACGDFDALCGMDADLREVESLRRTIRKWQPRRSKGYIRFAGDQYDNDNLPYHSVDEGSDVGNLLLGVGVTGNLVLNFATDLIDEGNLLFVNLVLGLIGGGEITYSLSSTGWKEVYSQDTLSGSGPKRHIILAKVQENNDPADMTITVTNVSGAANKRALARMILLPGEYPSVDRAIVGISATSGVGAPAGTDIPEPNLNNITGNICTALAFVAGNVGSYTWEPGGMLELDSERTAGGPIGIGASEAYELVAPGVTDFSSFTLSHVNADAAWSQIALIVAQHNKIVIPVDY